MALTVHYNYDKPVVYLGPGKGSRNPTAAELKIIQTNPSAVTFVDRYGKPMSASAVAQQSQQLAAMNAEAARLSQMTPAQQAADRQARQRAEAAAAEQARAQAAAQAEAQRQAQLAEQQRIAQAAEAQRQAQLAEQQRIAAAAEQQRQAQLAEQQRQAQIAEQARQAQLAEQQRIAQQQAQAQAEAQRQAAAQAEAQRLLAQQQAAAKPVVQQPVPTPVQSPVQTPAAAAPSTGYQPLNYTFDTRTPFKGVNIPANLGSITAVQGGRPVWSRTPTQGGTAVNTAPATGTSSWGKSSSTTPATTAAPVAPK